MTADILTSREFDVAVVGAGPAGSATALALQQAGISQVALIDREKFPRDKTCGDGLGPGVIKVLDDLNLGDLLDGYTPIQSLAVSSPDGTRVSGPLPAISGRRPIGFVIPRQKFDALLMSTAVRLGASDFTGWILTTASYDAEIAKWRLTLTETLTGKTEVVRCRVLVGADGARSKVRRLLGERPNDDRYTGIGARIYVTSENQIGSALRLDFVRSLLPAYGWVFPSGHHAANIGVGIDLAVYRRRRRHLNALVDEYGAEVNRQFTTRVDPSTYAAFILPYGTQMPKLGHPTTGAALVGDAGSMINPLTGEGIFYGMFGGHLLGGEIAAALHGASAIGAALDRYERSFRESFFDHFLLNWRMKEKVSSERWCNIVIRACRRDRAILADLIDMMMGDKRYMSNRTMLRIFFASLF